MNQLKEIARRITYRHLVEISNTIDKQTAIEYVKKLSDIDLKWMSEYFPEYYQWVMDLMPEHEKIKNITNETLSDTLYVKLLKCKDLLERSAEELQNCYGRDIELTLKIHEILEELNNVS
jgi:hypothetical protein